MQEEENLARIYEDLKVRCQGKFEVFRTCPRQLEILPLGYSKGKTLSYLMKKKGWSGEDVFAFGDGENDVSMFGVVENSFAMANAREFVQSQARYVTSSNNEDGIAKALKRWEKNYAWHIYY